MATAVANAPDPIDPADPLTEAHASVVAWVEAAVRAVDLAAFRPSVLPSSPSTEEILAFKGAEVCRFVRAATIQITHWRDMVARIEAEERASANQANRLLIRNASLTHEARLRIFLTQQIITLLMRGVLPWSEDDLRLLVRWSLAEPIEDSTHPVRSVIRALKGFARRQQLGPDLHTATIRLARRLEAMPDRKLQRLGHDLGTLGAATAGEAPPAQAGTTDSPKPQRELKPEPAGGRPIVPLAPTPCPAPAGHPLVLRRLKQLWGIAEAVDPEPGSRTVGVDDFPLLAGNPLEREHDHLSSLWHERRSFVAQPRARGIHFSDLPTAQKLIWTQPEAIGRVLLAIAERHVHALFDPARVNPNRFRLDSQTPVAWLAEFAHLPWQFDRAGRFDWLLFEALEPRGGTTAIGLHAPILVGIEADARRSPLTEGERFVLARFRAALVQPGGLACDDGAIQRLTRLIGDGLRFVVTPGEVWSDAINTDLARVPEEARASWVALLCHLQRGSPARPTKKWRTEVAGLVARIGIEPTRAALQRWLRLVEFGPTLPPPALHSDATAVMPRDIAEILRGLLWAVLALPSPTDFVDPLTRIVADGYRKVPEIGPRAKTVSTGALAVLVEIGTPEVIEHLTTLRKQLKPPAARKAIDAALATLKPV